MYETIHRSEPHWLFEAPPSRVQPIGTGTRAQFRRRVFAIITADLKHPLRFLLNGSGTGFKRLASRAHSNLINHPYVWEAGHIMSDKLGGTRLMVQSAWENQ